MVEHPKQAPMRRGRLPLLAAMTVLALPVGGLEAAGDLAADDLVAGDLAAGERAAGERAAGDLAAAGPIPAGGWQPVDLVYEVHAGGLHAFTIELKADLDSADYDMTMDLRTDGTLSWMLDWTMSSVVSGRPVAGRTDAGGLAPRRFRTESLWRGKARSVEVAYGASGPPEVTALPPPEDDDRDAVPEALRSDTVDPLSAALALIYAVAWRDGCALSLSIFDGRRRFDAKSRDDGEREVAVGALSPYGGLARACAVTLDPVSGFKKNAEHKPRKEDFTVFLRQVSPEVPPLPVRVEAETRFGGVRVHLKTLEILPRG